MRGEVRIYLFNHESSSLKLEKNVWLKSSNGDFNSYNVEKLVINTSKSIIKFSSIDDRNAAEDIRGFEIYLSRSDFPPVSKDEFYVNDIIGFKVFNEQKDFLGVIDDILSISNKNIMVISLDGYESLVPLEDEFVKLFDFEGEKIIVQIIEGLLD